MVWRLHSPCSSHRASQLPCCLLEQPHWLPFAAVTQTRSSLSQRPILPRANRESIRPSHRCSGKPGCCKQLFLSCSPCAPFCFPDVHTGKVGPGQWILSRSDSGISQSQPKAIVRSPSAFSVWLRTYRGNHRDPLYQMP